MTKPPASLVALASRVEQRISDVLAPEEQRWSAFDEDLVSPVAEIRRLVASGGKRLRPLLTLATAGLCGYQGDGHIKLAASVEFMHTATLLHDDVVDQSDMRRGKQAARKSSSIRPPTVRPAGLRRARTSLGPSTGKAATGVPHAMASTITSPKVSDRLGKTNRSALA